MRNIERIDHTPAAPHGRIDPGLADLVITVVSEKRSDRPIEEVVLREVALTYVLGLVRVANIRSVVVKTLELAKMLLRDEAPPLLPRFRIDRM